MRDDATARGALQTPEHLGAIDALRGYAILMVIGVHTLPFVPALAWPAKRLLLLGVYGVQLFFLASAVTLMMSWSRSKQALPARCRTFYLHRVLRIAPLYFLAIAFYWLVNRRSAADFSASVLSATLLFYNAWSPYFIRTVPGWTPVPGGWSIGVEFCFYFIFPVLAMSLTTLRRSACFVLLALLVLVAGAQLGAGLYPELSAEQRANFLYFWPPNHLIVFALGCLLYHLLHLPSLRALVATRRIGSNGASVALLLALWALSLYGMRKQFDWAHGLPPTHVLITLCFMPWALVLILKGGRVLVNRAIVAFGKVSFSIYILHFAVLELADAILRRSWSLPATGIWSLAYEFGLLVLTCAISFALAKLTYRYIEKPGIDLSRSLTRGRSVTLAA